MNLSSLSLSIPSRIRGGFRATWDSLVCMWCALRIRHDVKAHGAVGAHLRVEIRQCPEDQIRATRSAFAARFLQFSNRQRFQWLQAQGVDVPSVPGLSVRQCQQRAALAWFDDTRGGAST